MLGRQKGGVFLSYARKDGEQFASRLRERITQYAPDILIKQDRNLLEGGVGWWTQTTDAIDSVDFLVLVMTPYAMTSETVRKEWRYARQQGTCVYPVKAAADSDLQFSDLPKWMNKAHFFDIDKEWESFLAHLRKGCDTPRVPFMAPDLPPHFVARTKELRELKDLLLRGDLKHPVTGMTALVGAGGFGKTTLVTALCHEEDILENFNEGILWVTLGEQPDVIKAATTLYAGLTDERPLFAGIEDAANKIAEKLDDRTCLLVIDNVWDSEHAKPFVRGGRHCARLITTRYPSVIPDASLVDLTQMSDSEADALLGRGLGLADEQIRALSDRLGNFPLALEAAHTAIQTRIRSRDSARGALAYLETALTRVGPRALPIEGAFLASFELLNAANKRRLTQLSIFPPSIAIPLAAAGALWALDSFETEVAATEIAASSLVRIDFQSGTMRLHDVLRGWLEQRLDNASSLHSQLADAWQNWYRLPHEYAWRWLIWHLMQAKRKADVERVLWDPMFLEAKLYATDVNGLIAAYEYLKPSHEAELMQSALRLSANVVSGKPAEFASQMVGRLLPYHKIPAVAKFVSDLAEGATKPWLRPLWPSLNPSGMTLIRTVETRSSPIYAVAIKDDGRRAVSASEDHTLSVWDLERGEELRTLRGHSGSVRDVAITPDGRRAVSASWDNSLKVWDLQSGRELLTLGNHAGQVNRVALTMDGRQAISASADRTLRLWDLEQGRELKRFEGHSDSVSGVALTPDGRHAISASWDSTLKIWDLGTAKEVCTLAGHSWFVSDVAVTLDGQRAISASYDNTLRVWDLNKRIQICTLTGHSSYVLAVAVSRDGRRAVSASADKTLKIWDLCSGDQLRTLAGHSASVFDVAMTQDGRRAFSASADKTLRIWDLEDRKELNSSASHSGSVSGIAVTADAQRAISVSKDSTLRIWQLHSGEELLKLGGNAYALSSVALTVDGQCAVCGCSDNTLKIWDLHTGSELRTLAGHSNAVHGVAVTVDGRIVSASLDKTLKVWDSKTAKEHHTLTGHASSVYGVAVTADGQYAISASSDHTLRVWDLANGSHLRTLIGHSDAVSAVAVTPDGQLVVSASGDNTLRIWDLHTGRELGALTGHSEGIFGVAVNANGELAASASWDTTVKVWDLSSRVVIASFTCEAPVRCCLFVSSDQVIAGDESGRLHLFKLKMWPNK